MPLPISRTCGRRSLTHRTRGRTLIYYFLTTPLLQSAFPPRGWYPEPAAPHRTHTTLMFGRLVVARLTRSCYPCSLIY
ncbi:hypothetical protein LX32DRAFT_158358 [Colletotrichum zoysiae]|uniref:Uncharacterized protein n=1 Tax=Colletotrichum zoysiae TaxID=1216348 RepID=A0AAD9HQX8_9PEZI|nr:hypothetical protein LX32DRAFT_158358 [Colletotrichum zoysiae]